MVLGTNNFFVKQKPEPLCQGSGGRRQGVAMGPVCHVWALGCSCTAHCRFHTPPLPPSAHDFGCSSAPPYHHQTLSCPSSSSSSAAKTIEDWNFYEKPPSRKPPKRRPSPKLISACAVPHAQTRAGQACHPRGRGPTEGELREGCGNWVKARFPFCHHKVTHFKRDRASRGI